MKITRKVINFNKINQTGGSGFVAFDIDAIKAKATKKSEDSLKAYELWKQQQNPGMSGSASVSQPQAGFASVSQPTPSQTTPGVASVSKPNPTLVASTSQTQSRKINSRGKKRLDEYLDPNYKKKYPYFSNGDIFYEMITYHEVGRRGKVEKLNEKKYLTNEKHYYYHVLFDDGQFETMQSEFFMLHDWETKLE